MDLQDRREEIIAAAKSEGFTHYIAWADPSPTIDETRHFFLAFHDRGAVSFRVVRLTASIKTNEVVAELPEYTTDYDTVISMTSQLDPRYYEWKKF